MAKPDLIRPVLLISTTPRLFLQPSPPAIFADFYLCLNHPIWFVIKPLSHLPAPPLPETTFRPARRAAPTRGPGRTLCAQPARTQRLGCLGSRMSSRSGSCSPGPFPRDVSPFGRGGNRGKIWSSRCSPLIVAKMVQIMACSACAFGNSMATTFDPVAYWARKPRVTTKSAKWAVNYFFI